MDPRPKAHKTGLLLDNDDALSMVFAKTDGSMGARGTAPKDSYIDVNDGVGTNDSRGREGKGGQEGDKCESHGGSWHWVDLVEILVPRIIPRPAFIFARIPSPLSMPLSAPAWAYATRNEDTWHAGGIAGFVLITGIGAPTGRKCSPRMHR
jgi:hypothetical protein